MFYLLKFTRKYLHTFLPLYAVICFQVNANFSMMHKKTTPHHVYYIYINSSKWPPKRLKLICRRKVVVTKYG